MVFDSQRSVTVLHGGNYAANYSDTWEWDGSSWRLATTGGPVRFAHAMAYSRRAARTVLFSGGPTASPIADTWEFTGSGAAAVFGQGCGTPPLVLSQVASALPRIHATAQASLANVPAALAFVALGWSRTSFGASPLPLSLAPFGLRGCDLLQSAEVVFAPVQYPSTTTATFDLAVPNAPGLVGLRVYLQGWAVAPGANPGQAIASNGLDWSIGW